MADDDGRAAPGYVTEYNEYLATRPEGSSELVGSSKTSIWAGLRKAWAMASFCHCPMESSGQSSNWQPSLMQHNIFERAYEAGGAGAFCGCGDYGHNGFADVSGPERSLLAHHNPIRGMVYHVTCLSEAWTFSGSVMDICPVVGI